MDEETGAPEHDGEARMGRGRGFDGDRERDYARPGVLCGQVNVLPAHGD
jgi:hypothetical protein